jgi:hypothetical protein
MAQQIDLFCVPQLADTECLEADHNGRSTYRYQSDLVLSAVPEWFNVCGRSVYLYRRLGVNVLICRESRDRARWTIFGYGRSPGCRTGECGRPRGNLRFGAFPVKDLNDMRRPGRQDDHDPAVRSVIARIDRAFTDLPEVRPGAGPYLRRVAECGWSGGRRRRSYCGTSLSTSLRNFTGSKPIHLSSCWSSPMVPSMCCSTPLMS